MKTLLQLSGLLLLGLAVFAGQAAKRSDGSDDAFRMAAVKLFESLDEDQKKEALKDYTDKDKYNETFPNTNRKALALSKLKPEQKVLVEDAIKAMTSDYGAERCLAVAKQTGANLVWINFYGAPGKDAPFAWRIATHHLTLVYADFAKDALKEFGPILLGGNPVNKLWDEEDKLAVALYQALTEDEKKAVQGKGGNGSGAPIGKNGAKIGELNAKAKPLAQQLFAKRLEVLSPDRRKMMDDILKQEGGIDNLRLAVWGKVEKSFHDGNNYSWRIGSDSIVCDWQGLDKQHLHMTVKGKRKG